MVELSPLLYGKAPVAGALAGNTCWAVHVNLLIINQLWLSFGGNGRVGFLSHVRATLLQL